MYVSRIVTLVMALAAETALAHMNMADPPPLRYKGNPNAVKAGKIDTDITSPNTAATFPCKGAIPDMDDPVAGAPVATWYPGEQHTVKIVGGASHNGGSCQLSISYDKGQTFTVVFSKIGACPTDPNIPFTLPADTPSADKVLFSWSWINHTGNREFYNNCAVLTIGAAKKKRAAPAVAFKDRPPMLVANIYHTAGAACVKEGVDALYPEPGPDFVNVSSTAALPDDCVTGQPMNSNPIVGGSGGSGSGGAPASGSASAPAGPGITPSVRPGQVPTSSASAVYVSSSLSSLSLLSVPSMLSSLLMPLPSSTVDLVSPSSPTHSTFVISPTASSLDGRSTLVTSTRSASSSSSSASEAAPSPSLIVIPITTSRQNNSTASATPSSTSSATKSATLTSISSHSTPGGIFIPSSTTKSTLLTSSSSHSTPGGIFIPSSTTTTSASASSSLSSGLGAAPPTNTPTPSSPDTTPSVSSSIPTTPSSSASATSSETVGLPSQTYTATSSAAPPTGTGSTGGGVLTGPCQPEGEWNCLPGGTSWQRCASGIWSVVVPMAPGTSCTPGQSSNLNKKRELYMRRRNAPRRDPVRRRAQAGVW
ncbi:hypothetical protein PG984_005607 [Apiospora sp. TS-2023a]